MELHELLMECCAISSFDELKGFEAKIDGMDFKTSAKSQLLRRATRYYVKNCPASY